jgi:hypothetical protein
MGFSQQLCGRIGFAALFAPQSQQSKQNSVSFLSKLADGAAPGLLQYAINDRLFDLRGELGKSSKVFPPSRVRSGKLIQKMLNAALAATRWRYQGAQLRPGIFRRRSEAARRRITPASGHGSLRHRVHGSLTDAAGYSKHTGSGYSGWKPQSG